MSTPVIEDPFGEAPIDEIPLRSAPLARVLAQVRFPRSSLIASDETLVRKFVSAMAGSYPIFGEEMEFNITISAEGVERTPSSAKVWRLRSADEAWQVSFGDTFVAVDTPNYTSRTEFCERVAGVWGAFRENFSPPAVDRIGVRYINRLVGEDLLDDLDSLIRLEALGGVTVPRPSGVSLVHSMQDVLYSIEDQQVGLQARWGVLPPGGSIDPSVDAIDQASWTLDLDAFQVARMETDVASVAERVEHLANHAYRYFRWVVTPEFLQRFGA